MEYFSKEDGLEQITRLSFVLGGLLLLWTWGRTKERPLSYFLFQRLDLKAGVLAVVVLTLGTIQFFGWWDILLFSKTFATQTLGLLLFWKGILLATWGKRALGPNWDPHKNNHPLITKGAYSVFRHPIYLGGFLAALGAEVALGSVFCLLSILGARLLNKACADEEKVLEKYFGEAYRLYKKRVRRFGLV